jgi:hypothetical protein
VPINPGNSGRPLLNLRGEAAGIDALKIGSAGVNGLDFAILSNEVLDLLKKNFDYLPPYLTGPTPKTVVARDSDAVPAASTSTVAAGAQMPTAAQTSAGTRMSTSATSNDQPAQRPSEKVSRNNMRAGRRRHLSGRRIRRQHAVKGSDKPGRSHGPCRPS